jgi:hypothetical protein
MPRRDAVAFGVAHAIASGASSLPPAFPASRERKRSSLSAPRRLVFGVAHNAAAFDS